MQKIFHINENDAGQRLDNFLQSVLPDISRSQCRKLITDGNAKLNGEVVKAGFKLRVDDRVEITEPEAAPVSLPGEDIPLDILHEDGDIVVLNKPAGLVVHPGAGNFTGTLVNALVHHCPGLSDINGNMRPGIVHRLDKYTSGLMVVAKTNAAHRFIAAQFDTREIVRTYYALVWGRPAEDEATIETHIARSRRDRKKMTVSGDYGKTAITNYTIIRHFDYFSLLELTLKTGRTHQIRVHLNHLNHPVFGDPEYNGRNSQIDRLPDMLRRRGQALLKLIDRQALHAKKLSFIHPKTKKRVEFESDLPEDFALLLEKLPKTMLLD